MGKSIILFTSIFILLSIVLSSCITGNLVKVPYDEMPEDSDEFNAEAELYAMDQKVTVEHAKALLAKMYPDFEDPEIENTYYGVPKRIIFESCEDSDEGKNFIKDGSTYATYQIGDKRKRAKFLDFCNEKDKFAVEYYCKEDGRIAKATTECVCWGNSCK